MNERTSRGGPRGLGQALAKAAKPAFARAGFAAADIVLRWREIVGPALAEHTAPQRATFPRGRRSDGTLHLAVEPALAVEVQHLAPVLIERVNTFYGYAAIARVAIRQQPVRRRRPPATVPPPLSEAGRNRLEADLAGIADARLKALLRRLGEGIGEPEGGG